jgi:hypothetical protein
MILAMITVLAVTVIYYDNRTKIPDSPEMERRRKEWERERREHQREHERWDRERNEHNREHEREKERERQRERERREEKHQQKLGLYWDEPTPGAHCRAYGTREYTARLWNIPMFYDWMMACKTTPIVIHNKTIETPFQCENRVSSSSSAFTQAVENPPSGGHFWWNVWPLAC